MTFSDPVWLSVAVAVLALGIIGLRVAETRRRLALERFVAGPLRAALTTSSSASRRRWKGGLLLAALALGCVALAGPTFGWRMQDVRHRGTDVLFAVDVSRSMLAPDVKPDRLTRAKLAVIDLLRKLEGDRVGLVAFAGSAFLQAPLTGDHAAFRESLEALDSEIIPRGGSDIGAVLHEAEEAFRTAPDSQKLLVLVSDGEDLAGNARVAAREAAKQGITVYTVGVGTPAGERIPLGRAGRGGFVVDPAGNVVTSRLDEETLRDVAEATGGFYVPLGAHGEGLETIYQRVLAEAPKQEYAKRSQRLPIQRYQWPLGLALALVVGEALLGERRRSRRAASAHSVSRESAEASPSPMRVGDANAAAARGAAAAALALALLLGSNTAQASAGEAEQAYAAGDYEQAHAGYRAAAEAAPDDARLRLNEGAAAYRAGKHEEAAEAFSEAIEHGDVPLQQRAYYDLGNARFRSAEAAAQASPEQARQGFEAAIEAYDGALALDPEDEDARFNRDVAKARLEALEQQQQQQQQDQQQQGQGGQQQEPQQGQQGDPQQQGQEQSQAEQQPSDGKQGQDQSRGAQGDQQQQGAQGQPDSQKEQQGQEGSEGQPQGEQPSQPQGGGAEPQPTDNAQATQPSEPKPGEGEEQKPLPGDAQPQRADGKEAGEAPVADGRGARAGEMSAEDAARLLDSLRGEESQSPLAGVQGGGPRSEDDEPTRNW